MKHCNKQSVEIFDISHAPTNLDDKCKITETSISFDMKFWKFKLKGFFKRLTELR